eukprot:gnl/TRDRNA2_/TRDRNA2_86983_c1_seq1.p1 gnl/TRDRNA2_/TRDRNA2_86983_c1~~gnl/TRDRNA2_/TRDRNA2_86983_c1_seq1.p1  ORF type:complete len:312 (-),score=57.50 gnl/TRDRNA2_/TRDRNA2_86983_c1_seq1:289-1158(-)
MEAERLYGYLGRKGPPEAGGGTVDLRQMFAVLRTTVTPDVSLERFASRVLTHYDSFEAAFAAACACKGDAASEFNDSPPHIAAVSNRRFLRWPQFHAFTVALDVNDENAAGLWNVLSLCQEDAVCADDVAVGGPEDDGLCAVSEATFVRSLRLWGPGTALEALRDRICEHFGSLAEGRRALDRRGGLALQGKRLTPEALGAALAAIGITDCDSEQVLSIVSVPRRKGGITLDDLIEAMRATRKGAAEWGPHSAQATVRTDTLQSWQKLDAIQADVSTAPLRHAWDDTVA